MRFYTTKGLPVIINRDHVVAIQPVIDEKTGVPVVGQTLVLTDLPPPNVPGAGHVSLALKGDYLQVALDLGIIYAHDIEEETDATAKPE